MNNRSGYGRRRSVATLCLLLTSCAQTPDWAGPAPNLPGGIRSVAIPASLCDTNSDLAGPAYSCVTWLTQALIQVPDLTVTEQIELSAVYAMIAEQLGDAFDQQLSPAVGRLVPAEAVLITRARPMGASAMSIDGRLVRLETGEVLAVGQGSGARALPGLVAQDLLRQMLSDVAQSAALSHWHSQVREKARSSEVSTVLAEAAAGRSAVSVALQQAFERSEGVTEKAEVARTAELARGAGLVSEFAALALARQLGEAEFVTALYEFISSPSYQIEPAQPELIEDWAEIDALLSTKDVMRVLRGDMPPTWRTDGLKPDRNHPTVRIRLDVRVDHSRSRAAYRRLENAFEQRPAAYSFIETIGQAPGPAGKLGLGSGHEFFDGAETDADLASLRRQREWEHLVDSTQEFGPVMKHSLLQWLFRDALVFGLLETIEVTTTTGQPLPSASCQRMRDRPEFDSTSVYFNSSRPFLPLAISGLYGGQVIPNLVAEISVPFSNLSFQHDVIVQLRPGDLPQAAEIRFDAFGKSVVVPLQ